MNEDIFYAVTLAIGVVTAVLILLEIRSNHDWNAKRASYELMNEMITSGRLTGAIGRLEADHGWSLLDAATDYDDVARGLSRERRAALDGELAVILRHLEMLSLSMRHGIVSEKICQDGFVAFFIAIHRACAPFMAAERARRGDALIYECFEHYAAKWRAAEDAAAARAEAAAAAG